MQQNKPPKKGLLRFTHTIKYSLDGLRYAWKYEESFRQEVAVFVLLIPLTFFVGNKLYDYILLLGSISFLLVVELLNSAVEAAVDRISSEKHELSKRAKDIGSAAVMLAILMCVIVWLSIFFVNFF
ncbi:MAG: diacylglycerol kinase [Lentisphaeraceae bacterium]|nr:diacylglycerol kinase [Lentisphaeraceae bacterium]